GDHVLLSDCHDGFLYDVFEHRVRHNDAAEFEHDGRKIPGESIQQDENADGECCRCPRPRSSDQLTHHCIFDDILSGHVVQCISADCPPAHIRFYCSIRIRLCRGIVYEYLFMLQKFCRYLCIPYADYHCIVDMSCSECAGNCTI